MFPGSESVWLRTCLMTVVFGKVLVRAFGLGICRERTESLIAVSFLYGGSEVHWRVVLGECELNLGKDVRDCALPLV